ncbi:MAG: hypothetical protein H6651_23820 [Ardenticatenales bacterium]|nr:hypothetical protein [Ardenticatenales bacterium]
MTRLKLIWADKALRWVVLAALVATFLYLLPTIIAGGAVFRWTMAGFTGYLSEIKPCC